MDVEWSKTGCLIVKTRKYDDERGYFTEIFKQSQFEPRFVQDNLSFSQEGVVRGMHFQTKNPQGKLVRCLFGMITDVVIDLRRNSTTYGVMEEFQLIPKSSDDIAVLIPPGFAHGFLALADSMLLYKCTTEYEPQYDSGIHPLDPDFDFPWKRETSVIISEKDKNLQSFKSFHRRVEF
jgi:dTDP-4-dehydrorhamnose 3,5-epimerase